MDRPRTRRAELAEETRGTLIAAARELFAEKGYAGVGTEQIVAAAKLTRGALYYHFEDKRDLFRTVYAEVDTELVQGIATIAAAEPDAWLRLVKGCDAFLDSALDPAVQRIVFLDGPSVLGWGEWHEAAGGVSGLQLIEAGLQAAIDEGALDIENPSVFAHLVVGALNEGAMYIAHADDHKAARREAGAALLRLLDGLRAR